MRKELGKITKVRFGIGGYDDCMFGLSFDFGGEGWGVSNFIGTWNKDPDQYCKWTIESRDKIFLDAFNRARELLKQAKVDDFYKLVGKPVEITFDGNVLHSWRLLTEVL